MSKCVIQAYDENHESLANITVPLMAKWCYNHGWSHQVVLCDSSKESYDHNYRKYPLVRSMLEHHQVVMWADADVVPVSGEDFPLGEKNVQVSFDRHGYCAGLVVYRNSLWTRQFVTGLEAIIPTEGIYRTHEQDCMKAILLIGQVSDNVVSIPESVVACPHSPKTTVKPVFLHLWTHTGLADSIQRAKEIAGHE